MALRLKDKSKSEGFILVSVLIILTGIALILSGMIYSVEIFMRINARNQLAQEAWNLSAKQPVVNLEGAFQKTNYLYSNFDLLNSPKIPWVLAWSQSPWREFYFVQKFPDGGVQVTWTVGTQEIQKIAVRQAWISPGNGVMGRSYGLAG